MLMHITIGVIVGIVCGAVTDELLRGADPRSAYVVGWGVLGGVVGMAIRVFSGPQGNTLIALSAAVGGLLLAFGSRARVSAQLERLRSATT